MKKKEMLLFCLLRRNARETLTNLSRQSRIPISTIYDRIGVFRRDLLKKYTAIVDWQKLGFNTRANIVLKVNKGQKEEMREFLENHQNVNTLIKINNGYDFLVETVFKNVSDVEEFLEVLEERYVVKTKQVFYVIEDIKRESFMSDPAAAELMAA